MFKIIAEKVNNIYALDFCAEVLLNIWNFRSTIYILINGTVVHRLIINKQNAILGVLVYLFVCTAITVCRYTQDQITACTHDPGTRI